MIFFNKDFNMKFFNLNILVCKLNVNPLFGFELSIDDPYSDFSFCFYIGRFGLEIEITKD